MNYYTEATKDRRKIQSAWSAYWIDHGYTVGKNGVTKIEAYDESGEMAHIPFIAVYKGDHLHARIPANSVEIVYTEPQS